MEKCSKDHPEEDVDACRGKGEQDYIHRHLKILLASKSLFKPLSSTDVRKSLFLSGSTIQKTPLHKLKVRRSTYKVKRKKYLERATTSKNHFDPDEENLLSAKPYATVANGRNSPMTSNLSSEKSIGV